MVSRGIAYLTTEYIFLTTSGQVSIVMNHTEQITNHTQFLYSHSVTVLGQLPGKKNLRYCNGNHHFNQVFFVKVHNLGWSFKFNKSSFQSSLLNLLQKIYRFRPNLIFHQCTFTLWLLYSQNKGRANRVFINSPKRRRTYQSSTDNFLHFVWTIESRLYQTFSLVFKWCLM